MTIPSRPDNIANRSFAIFQLDRQRMLLHNGRARCYNARFAILPRKSEGSEERADLGGLSAGGRGKVGEREGDVVRGEGGGSEDEFLEEGSEGLGRVLLRLYGGGRGRGRVARGGERWESTRGEEKRGGKSGTDPMMAVESLVIAPLRTGSILVSSQLWVDERSARGGAAASARSDHSLSL